MLNNNNGNNHKNGNGHVEKFENIKDRFKLMMTKLHRRTPDDLIGTRTENGKELEYIEWTTAADIGDDVVGHWQSYVKEIKVIGDLLVMVGGVKIKDPDTGEWLSRENVGFSSLSDYGVGDPASNAFAMMFKRSWVLWGPGRDLYKAPDYWPHRVATDEQVDKILGYLKQNLFDEEATSVVSRLLSRGELTIVDAAKVLKHAAIKLEEQKIGSNEDDQLLSLTEDSNDKSENAEANVNTDTEPSAEASEESKPAKKRRKKTSKVSTPESDSSSEN